jgi:hypothetical protein
VKKRVMPAMMPNMTRKKRRQRHAVMQVYRVEEMFVNARWVI